MKYFIAGVVGGIVSTIWTLVVFIGGMLFMASITKDSKKVERRTYEPNLKEVH